MITVPTFAQTTVCSQGTDYLEAGQALLNEGDYEEAIAVFTCAIEQNPRELHAYRGRIEGLLMTGAYSDAMLDYAAIKVNVIPETPDAMAQILTYYSEALTDDPENIRLMAGLSFNQWYNFNPEGALVTLERLLELEPDNLYGLVMRGNNRFFMKDLEAGEADFARAFEIEPESDDIYFIMADGYLYGLGELEKAQEAVTVAADMGLDTPRVDAIFATTHFYLGNIETALPYYQRHIERTTAEVIDLDALAAGESISIAMIPGQRYQIPIAASAGETLVISAASDVQNVSAMGDFNEVDTIMLLLDENGDLVTGNDDNVGLNAGFEYQVSEAGSYTLVLSSFEGAGMGDVTLSRGESS